MQRLRDNHTPSGSTDRTSATPAPGYAQGFEACREAAKKIALSYERQQEWPKHPKSKTTAPTCLMQEVIAAAIAALPTPAGVEDWQDISTAPKDMTEVIVLCGRKDIRLGWYFAPSSTTFGWRDQHNAPIKPTHWMPRPKWPAILAKPAQEGGS